ncbi:MAG: pyrroline-5-carboxylate reductase [Lentihominibacter sp.]
MNIGFVGTGNMGGAIARGFGASEAASGSTLIICNRTKAKSEALAAEIASEGICTVMTADSAREAAGEAEIVIIGVKPQGMEELLEELAPAATGDRIFVSMAAGVSIASMKEKLGSGTKIVRIMPNTPAMVGCAMTSLSACDEVSGEELARVKAIFDSVGRAEVVPEDMIDCVIGVSGSSPAYTYMYIEALADAATDRGMEPEKARVFAAQAVLGAAEMVLRSSESLKQLRDNVCSPGGTTIEAVKNLQKNGFQDTVREASEAAVKRSIEMTGGKK